MSETPFVVRAETPGLLCAARARLLRPASMRGALAPCRMDYLYPKRSPVSRGARRRARPSRARWA